MTPNVPPSPGVLNHTLAPVVAERRHCQCHSTHQARLVVVTGGPGAGKTAVLEMVQRQFCEHVVVLPESASILFGGGFPRSSVPAARRAAQRAIFHVEHELEQLAVATGHAAVVLCDRGTLDGLAYWPGDAESFFHDLGTTREREFSHYSTVIHLRTPTSQDGYNHDNPLRVESARQAHAIDVRIAEAWRGHPRVIVIPSAADFVTKAAAAMAAITAEVPACCAPRAEPPP